MNTMKSLSMSIRNNMVARESTQSVIDWVFKSFSEQILHSVDTIPCTLWSKWMLHEYCTVKQWNARLTAFSWTTYYTNDLQLIKHTRTSSKSDKIELEIFFEVSLHRRRPYSWYHHFLGEKKVASSPPSHHLCHSTIKQLNKQSNIGKTYVNCDWTKKYL